MSAHVGAREIERGRDPMTEIQGEREREREREREIVEREIVERERERERERARARDDGDRVTEKHTKTGRQTDRRVYNRLPSTPDV